MVNFFKTTVVVFIVVFLIGISLSHACNWDPLVNKCHPVRGEVVVYKHSECRGDQYYSFNGNNQIEWLNLTTLTWPDGTNLNDSISCYVIGHKTDFYYYEHINLGGKNVHASNTYNDRLVQKSFKSKDWWNDRISSVRVFPK
jgi:signal peptidase I